VRDGLDGDCNDAQQRRDVQAKHPPLGLAKLADVLANIPEPLAHIRSERGDVRVNVRGQIVDPFVRPTRPCRHSHIVDADR
jgi:hypothetical protein